MSTIKGFADTIAWYDANAEKYAATIQDKANFAMLDQFAALVGKGAKILDAGCAAGRDTKFLQDRGLLVTGLDISQSLLAIARQKYPELEFVEGNFLNLPFIDNTFDGVWARASLLHLETVEDVIRALSEFNRVLKPGGVIHVYIKQQLGEEKASVVSDSLSNHDRFFQWFTKTEIEELLQKTGFVITMIEDNVADLSGREEVKWITVLATKRGGF